MAFVLFSSLIALFLLRPMDSVRAPCQGENLSGTILTLSPGPGPGSLTIGLNTEGEGTGPFAGGIDMRISLKASVHVYLHQGIACYTARRESLSDLKVGQTVRAWSSSGITLESYPGWLEDVTDLVIF
jgi:hypothetical protein